MNIYQQILNRCSENKKMLAVLVDPDKIDAVQCHQIGTAAESSGADFIFCGGSLLTQNNFEECILILKSYSLPVIIFPGNTMQISAHADAILFLSLISGRNPDLLIGRHVLAAPLLDKLSVETIPTGYMLIDSGSPTSVSYMSGTFPIPHDKNEIAVYTALAGQMLGLKMIYLEAGSGARFPVSASMIKAVRKKISVPLITGGGIKTPEKAFELCEAGSDIIVIGNILEKDLSLLAEFSHSVHSAQTI